MNLSLFPRNEEWGTGDEALDVRLSSALRKAAEQLSLTSISEFYFFGLSLKTRAYNPAFAITIEQVTKALLYYFSPEEYNDVLLKKVKGHYAEKERVSFDFEDSEKIIQELLQNHKYRYNNQIDFFLNSQTTLELNPFIQHELRKAPYDLQVKIIFKEFKNFLSGEITRENYSDAFFQALKLGKNALVIENFAEIWYDGDQLFSFSRIPA